MWNRGIFVSEPYGLSDHHVQELLEFCRVLKLGFDIEASSFHFPARTLRIRMWPQEWGSPPSWSEPARPRCQTFPTSSTSCRGFQKTCGEKR